MEFVEPNAKHGNERERMRERERERVRDRERERERESTAWAESSAPAVPVGSCVNYQAREKQTHQAGLD